MADTINILDYIDSPRALHDMSDSELESLAAEIRRRIIATTSKTGGHVASSLGAVEIILALHSLLDTPKDKIIFDVGHQAYAHKLVTGRASSFDTLRTYHGISGFPRPSESPYDVHPSGHASDSLSVASGIARAHQVDGSNDRVVVVIGDAALAGGMAFEALNYIGSQELPITIILNDNEMSISSNVGALMKHFGNIRATAHYREAREALQDRFERSGRTGRAFVEFGKRAKDSMKQMFIPESMIYENMGIVCTSPIDGHDIHQLREMLSLTLQMDGPVLIHAVTKKGMGYSHAEADPERFHGIGPYDVATGRAISQPGPTKTYTQMFSDALVREAAEDDSIYAITAAMEGGTGLREFHKRCPDRFVDVGIAEEQAVGMASGLAIAGKRPVVAVYSTFMQRALDQMIIDVALPNLDVVFALDRAGLVGDDGPTHHGVFDLAFLRMVPNMKVMVPSGGESLSDAVHTAFKLSGPVAIRYPRGSSEVDDYDPEAAPKLLEVGKSRVVRDGGDVAILAFGRMVRRCMLAADILAEKGIEARVVDMLWAKPLDEDAISDASKLPLVVTVEEGVISGGVGEGVLDVLAQMGSAADALTLGISDRFVLQGKSDFLLEELGLDAQGIAASVESRLSSL